MPVAQAISAGLGVVAGAAQFFDALGKEKRAKKELSRLQQPFYKIQNEYTQNRNLSAGIAGGGMPAASLDYLTTESHRGLGAGISGILQGGGDPGSISKIFDVYNRSIDKTQSANAEQQLKNIQYFIGVNKDLAGQKTMQWALNEYQPYQNKLKEITRRRAAAEQNKWGGIQTAIGSLGAAATGGQNDSLLDRLFAEKTPPGVVANLPTSIGSNLPNGAPMGIDPVTGLPPVAPPPTTPGWWPKPENQPFGQSPLNPFP